MRCAALRIACPEQVEELSSISWDIAIGLAFVVGLLLFGISSSILRTERMANSVVKEPAWPKLVDESLAQSDKQLRLDMIERLGIVRTEWSQNILERARSEERDRDVLGAIERVLHS